MASTLADMTLTASISETKTSGGTTTTFGKSRTISSAIREFVHLNRKVSGAFTPLVEFKSSPTESGVQFDADLVKYVRITNLDDSAKASLALIYGEQISGTVGTFSLSLGPGDSFVMGSPIEYCFEAEGAPQRDVLSIEARGLSSATPDIEVVIGSE